MRDLFYSVKRLAWFRRLGRLLMFVWKNGMNSLLYPSKQQRFNGLRFLFFVQYTWQFAPKKGIDNFRANLYLGFRRRLKGLAKLNFCRSEVG
jgi:hypothetical protein